MKWLVILLVAASALSCTQDDGAAGVPPEFDVLVVTKTAGFRHESIADGMALLRALGSANGFSVTQTEDLSNFTTQGLAPYAVIVLLNTTGDFLNDPQQAALQAWYRSGKGIVGVHAATDAEYNWPWYGELLGRYFTDHPAIQPADLVLATANHPITSGLPTRFRLVDEYYNFSSARGPAVTTLLTVDESTYQGGTMGNPHPIAWCKEFEGGRSFYTATGHTRDAYANASIRVLLVNGIRWAAGR